jgi:hypothetical protein
VWTRTLRQVPDRTTRLRSITVAYAVIPWGSIFALLALQSPAWDPLTLGDQGLPLVALGLYCVGLHSMWRATSSGAEPG